MYYYRFVCINASRKALEIPVPGLLYSSCHGVYISDQFFLCACCHTMGPNKMKQYFKIKCNFECRAQKQPISDVITPIVHVFSNRITAPQYMTFDRIHFTGCVLWIGKLEFNYSVVPYYKYYFYSVCAIFKG